MDKKMVILISGRGSNMERIVNAVSKEEIQAQVAAVIANSPNAAGLTFAKKAQIPTHGIDHTQFKGREAFETELMRVIDSYNPDLVVLAGFMRILTPDFVSHYEGRLMNIHPSLLPAFPGLHTHLRAIQEGVKCHGCTVHFVTPELDHGPIVIQGIVPIYDDDTEEKLAARVLKLEHQIYPQAVKWFFEDRLSIKNGVVLVKNIEYPESQLLGASFE